MGGQAPLDALHEMMGGYAGLARQLGQAVQCIPQKDAPACGHYFSISGPDDNE